MSIVPIPEYSHHPGILSEVKLQNVYVLPVSRNTETHCVTVLEVLEEMNFLRWGIFLVTASHQAGQRRLHRAFGLYVADGEEQIIEAVLLTLSFK